MMPWWPVLVLFLIVSAVLTASRVDAAEWLFTWLPAPLWCYVLPMLAVSLGWLPQGALVYRTLIGWLMPVALGLLLLGVDVPSILRVGWRVLAATGLGSFSIVLGAPLIAWALQRGLPPEAWKGVGALAATWTGGSMNLLSVKIALNTPEPIFASLILVDALIAYGWMALLVGLASHRTALERWLRADGLPLPSSEETATDETPPATLLDRLIGGLLALGLAAAASVIARWLPVTGLVTSRSGWTVLGVTTLALASSCVGAIRRVGRGTAPLGLPFLYLVLAAMGAQASFEALRAAPMWVVLGVMVAAFHGLVMLLGGRALRLPLGLLATASQANLGGVVSTPLVGAVYEQRLVPVGLLLAIGCNAVGTYWGLLSASICRWLTRG